MPRNWMDRLRKKLTRFPRRRKATWHGPVAQTLEERTYLSVSSLFAGGELQIIADADDDIVLGIDPASPGTDTALLRWHEWMLRVRVAAISQTQTPRAPP